MIAFKVGMGVKIGILSYGRKTTKGKGPVKEKRKYTHDVAGTIRV